MLRGALLRPCATLSFRHGAVEEVPLDVDGAHGVGEAALHGDDGAVGRGGAGRMGITLAWAARRIASRGGG